MGKIYLILQPITAHPSLREVYQILVGVELGWVCLDGVCVYGGVCVWESCGWVCVCSLGWAKIRGTELERLVA